MHMPPQPCVQAVVCRLPTRCSLGASDSNARFPAPASLDGPCLRTMSVQATVANTDSPLVCRVAAGVPAIEADGPGGIGGGSGDGSGRSWGEGGANEGDDEDITLLTREQVLRFETCALKRRWRHP